MDPTQYAVKEDLWKVAADVAEVRTCQIVHNERINRLERRQDEDARVKSVWGSSSPFPGVLSGTPSSGMVAESSMTPLNLNSAEPLNPQAEAFTYDQNSHLIRNLQLDNDEEPRRGASRANSVRFDESTMHGHWGQGSRSSGDFGLVRPGSGFGGHPMTERSFSHRSDGRMSLTGNSAHSTRANSLGMDIVRPDLIDLLGEPIGPPPGFLVLGHVPSIIRCWLQERFSNETLLYASVCTGALSSTIDFTLVRRLQLEHQIVKEENGTFTIKLSVFLPEATIIQQSAKLTSSDPQVPALAIRFRIVQSQAESSTEWKRLGLFIGSDALRMHNADILLSRNVMTLYDEERDKLSVPLVRPENDAIYKQLTTNFACKDVTEHDLKMSWSAKNGPERVVRRSIRGFAAGEISNGGHDSGVSVDDHPEFPRSSETSRSPTRLTSPELPSTIGETAKTASSPLTPASPSRNRTRAGLSTLKIPSQSPAQPEGSRRSVEFIESERPSPLALSSPGPGAIEPGSSVSRPSPSGIWGSWRRDSPKTEGSPNSNGVNPIGHNRGASHPNSDAHKSRGRSMKVLKPSRSSISRSTLPASASTKEQSASKRMSAQDGQWRAGSRPDDGEKDDGKQKKISANKSVSGGSAFPWLTPTK